MPSTLGSTTTSRFEHAPEAHKLHLDFEVAAGQTVHKADPVIFATNGKVQAAADDQAPHTIIGVSIHEATAGQRATIAMRGYTVVNAEAQAASLNAGPVEVGPWNATTGRREYAVAADTTDTVGHAIEQVVADGDAVRVCILG